MGRCEKEGVLSVILKDKFKSIWANRAIVTRSAYITYCMIRENSQHVHSRTG